jgi:putative effector of murein hydrolase
MIEASAQLPISFAHLSATIALGTLVTVAAYWLGVLIQRTLGGNPVANPVLIAIVLIATVLQFSKTPYANYFAAARIIHFLLGPVMVALAVPLAAGLRQFRSSLAGAVPAIAMGSLVSAATGLWIVHLLGGSAVVAHSMTPKAATTPIAIGISQRIGGQPSLTATFAILSGILVAVSVGHVLNWCRVTDWRAYGVAAGTAGSGIGTARAFQLNELAGAFAGLALGLNGLATALISPVLIYLSGPK